MIEKDNFISKLRRQSSAFEADVIDIESSYRSEIEENKLTIDHLKSKLEEKDYQVRAKSEELLQLMEKYNKLAEDVKHMKQQVIAVNNYLTNTQSQVLAPKTKDAAKIVPINTQSEVEAMSIEKSYAAKAAEVTHVHAGVEEIHVAEVVEESHRNPTAVKESTRLASSMNEDVLTKRDEIISPCLSEEHNKVLIMSDEEGRNIATSLRKLLNPYHFQIDSYVYPNLDFNTLCKLAANRALPYSGSDYVILLFSTTNIQNCVSLRNALRYLLPSGRSTNILVMPRYSSVIKK
nr:unnamed protein product [Callosobruchus analis]